jgi:hypothetical protein
MPDVLITGLPRSGLTLASALIDSLPNSVSLNAPQVQGAQARKLQETIPFCKWLAGDFVWQRSRLLTQDPVNDYRAPDGSHILDNLKDPRLPRDENGEPQLTSFVRPGLKDDFILAMKHDALYTCILPTLVQMEHFNVIAIIRHPYDVIHSWQQAKGQQISEGKVSFARSYWSEASLLDPQREFDLLDRMVQVYELFLKRYYELRQSIHIIKYEDLVQSPELISNALKVSTPPPALSQIVNLPRIRQSELQEQLRDRFRKYGVFVGHYYPDILN